jgi:hypothetical protein
MIAKNGKKEPDYIHPTLKEILKPYLWNYYLPRTSNANCPDLSGFYSW